MLVLWTTPSIYQYQIEDSRPIFLHDTLAHDVASPYQVWLQKVQQLRTHPQDEHSLEFWTFSVILTLTTTEQSNLFTRQSTSWWCAIKPSLLAKGSAGQILKRNILIILSITVTLTLKTANQSFWKTIWLTVMHHHTKSGSKRFSVSEANTWTNIHWYFAVTLTLNTTIQLLHKILWFIIMYYHTKFGSKRIRSSKDTVDIVIFWSQQLLHTDASQYQVWKENVWWFSRYHLDKN